ncbi:hypothetical protein DFJ58DRAFT_800784 [Suillus subalutaceus]|uniref:uncharacterized protein n=1 Tax=Suillus subalutaceus TaxID=48586 RepID=UPI001B879BAF|nr:uncharacterized protein DFJ58DRAFT_800784 [Suillus subalutaceus]KAG1845475.1 hypothetical protein DFJ58DRAFT_800784 [Suillus subalutaceus]
MSLPFTTYGDHSTDYLSAQHPDSSPSDYFKSSYNDDVSDLIDQYAEPYSRTSRHQTFAVSTDLLDDSDSRDRSFSTEQKGLYSVDKVAEEDAEPDPPNHDYPPTLKQEKPIDTRSCWAKILPDSWACRLFVLTVVIETAVDLAIEGDLFVRLQDDSGKLAVYVSVFALAHVFQLVMAVDAVYARNTLQFLSLIIFNLLFLLYAVIEIGEIKDSSTTSAGIVHVSVTVLTDVVPAVISVAEIAYIGLGWKIYNEFGWKVYKFLGADRRIKKMYATYQIFECLVKFDIFFWVGFSVQFIWLVLQKDDVEYYITWAALPLSILLLVEGHLAARHENKWMMGTFMFGSMGALVYFSYKLFRVIQYRDSQYVLYWKSLSTFSAIAIVLLVITIIFSVLVMRNFGRGLKASIARSKTHTQGRGSQHLNRGPMSMNPNRMSIE